MPGLMLTGIMSFAIGAGLMALIILVCDIFLEPGDSVKRPKPPMSRWDYPGAEHFFVMFCAIKYFEYETGSLTNALNKVVEKTHSEGRQTLHQYNVFSEYPIYVQSDMRNLRKCIVLNDAHRWETLHESNRVFQRKVATLMDVYFDRIDDIPDFENHELSELDDALLGNQWAENFQAIWTDIKRIEKQRALQNISNLKEDTRNLVITALEAYELSLKEDYLFEPANKDRFDMLVSDVSGWDRLSPRHESRNLARFFRRLRDGKIRM